MYVHKLDLGTVVVAAEPVGLAPGIALYGTFNNLFTGILDALPRYLFTL
jgi:hypothetical protein